MSKKVAYTLFFMVVMTLISKFLGFIRETVIANFYGTSYIVDSYVIAVAIPSIIFGGIFIAIATAYMPTLSTVQETEGKLKANRFTSQIINVILLLSILVSIIGFVFSDQIVAIFASGFTGKTAALTSFYIKITFTYVIFTSLSSIFDSYMQYEGSYLKPIVSGYFYNAAIILFVVISAYTSHYLLAFGIFAGALLRLIFIGVSARKKGFIYSLDFSINESVRKILHLAVPVFIGTYILQINSFVDKTLASGLPVGSVSALNYGMILITLITGLTVSVLVTMIYPKLTRANTNENLELFNDIVEKGVGITAIITIPFTFGIIAFNSEVVQIVYERGAFDPNATKMTAGAFLFYGIGLTFFALNELLTKVFYSMRNTKAPIVCSGVSVIINIGLNLILVDIMGHRGLALATSIAAAVNTIMLVSWIQKAHPNITIYRSKRKLITIIIAALISVLAAYLVNIVLVSNVWMPRILYLLIDVFLAGLLYLVLLRFCNIKEINYLQQLIKR